MEYNKLVRDLIPEYIKKKGGSPVFHIADVQEYSDKLKEKLLEEVREFLEDENEEEFADILEVLDAIANHKAFNPVKIAGIKERKFNERGGFKERIILEKS